jgi:hypothetical protein
MEDVVRMIRPPSNASRYDAFWSLDPAFIQLPKDASKEEQDAHEAKWQRARETGDYSELAIDGAQPTKFVMKPIKADHYAALVDIARSGEGALMGMLAFRVALDSIANFPEQVTTINHPKFGKIATVDCFDKAGIPGGVTNLIASELGGLAMEKARQLSFLS